ncbi:hypothetical protein BKA62DRAFT_766688 [Auriculariales sp. MPI-PUGE-AT-0066]|nr:hypothetical protein BKA62DRAFT_766688 [Auriculariales sp. MPI-PUGE-AT-0066]
MFQGASAPGTPPPRQATSLLELATVSPPTSLLRSPRVAFTGLTKTYLNNDFRQLRTLPSGRINTSRLPSQHVDDFENASASSQVSPTHSSPMAQQMVAAVPMPASLPMNPVLHLPTVQRF